MVDTKDYPLIAANINKFHTHLDECEQCRENPFELCAVGHSLITGTTVDDPKATFHDRIVFKVK
jgi:hypothetical protein